VVSARAAILLLALLSACHVGRSVTRFAPARSPAGARVDVRLMSQRLLVGELLAVDDTSLLVLSAASNPAITRVAIAQIHQADLEELGVIVARGRFITLGRRRLAINLGRYPQGMTPELLASLLATYHQSGGVATP